MSDPLLAESERAAFARHLGRAFGAVVELTTAACAGLDAPAAEDRLETALNRVWRQCFGREVTDAERDLITAEFDTDSDPE